MKHCSSCSTGFEVSDEDRVFYDYVSPVLNGKKFQIPEPDLCPPCRMQRRMSWRNERKNYRRKCGLCGKSIIAMYAPECPFPVYCPECWWSDRWDPVEYGADYDFSRPFFEQFIGFFNRVPHFSLAVLQTTMENSDFCNHAGYLKNCYLIVNSDESEKCLYGKGMNRCFDCVDGFKIYDCQACYETLNSTNCSFSTYLIDSHNSSECHFSSSLIGCKNCFGCVNLRNKEFWFFNEKCTEKEYQEKVASMQKKKSPEEIVQEFLAFRTASPQKWMQEKNTENCTGDYLVNCKDSFHCFDAEFLEQSKYCSDIKKGGKMSFRNHDITYFGMGVDASYECSVAGYNANHTLFCENVWDSSDSYYSMLCPQGTHDLFGCVGLRHAGYSIFNKKYSKEKYEEIAAKIIGHMMQTGEWGKFFPTEISPFGYNETTATEYFPLTQRDVEKRGWKWYPEKEPDFSEVTKIIPAEKLPRRISEIPDDILNWAIQCSVSGRLFKIQKAELDFYRRMDIPVPRLHPDVRHEKRMSLRNPRRIWERKCAECKKEMETTFAPEREEKVYCEKCYLNSVN